MLEELLGAQIIPNSTTGAFQTTYGGSIYDPFVFKLNSAGNGFIYSTFMGNGNQDLCASIAVDAIGQVWVVGQSTGNYLTTPGAYQSIYGGGPWDVFIAKLNATGSVLLFRQLYMEGRVMIIPIQYN